MFAVSVSAQVNIANGLLAYYPYNGNANDESGNGYNGTSVVLSTDRFGIPNKAYDCQNTASTSTINFDLDSSYTVNIWFNTVASNYVRLFSWSDDIQQPRKFTSALINRPNSNAYIEGNYTAYDNNFCGLNENSAFAPSSANPNPYTDGQWHMLTLIRNNNQLSLHIDSVLIDNKSIVDNCTQLHGLTTQFFLVGSNYLPNLGYIGKLDDVMIHNRPLNTAEISYLYNLNSSWSSTTSTDMISSNELKLFPNPVNNSLNIQLEEVAAYSLEVTDLNGRKIYSSKLTGQNFELNTTEWLSGIYIIKLTNEKGQIYFNKVVKA